MAFQLVDVEGTGIRQSNDDLSRVDLDVNNVLALANDSLAVKESDS